MAEIHTLKLELLARDGNAPQRLIEKFEKEYQVHEPQRITRKLKASDNLVEINVPSDIEFKYVLLMATYSEDDTANSIKKDDPAPLKARFNGSSDEFTFPDGVIFWTGDLNQLHIATTYDVNKIKFESYFG
jgi:hypothetical protein